MLQLTLAVTRAARLNPDKIALIDGPTRITRQQFLDRVARLAGALQRLGIGADDRVAILAHTSQRYIEAIYATLWAGGIVVPVSTRYALPETAFLLNDSGAKVLIVADEFVSQVAELRAAAPSVEAVIRAETTISDGFLAYETLINQHEPVADAGRANDDVAVLFYTGGTTGRSKGVMLTHANIHCNSYAGIAHTGMNEHLIGLHAGPLYHAAAGSRVFTNTILGATHVVIPKFSVKAVLEAIQTHRVTMMSMVPTMLTMMLNEPTLDDYDLSSLDLIGYGGAPMPVATLEGLLKRLPHVRFLQAYGMTELSPAITYLEPSDHVLDPKVRHRLGSGGRVAYGCDLRVVDAQDRDVPRGEIGEIIVRGPHMMKGYWQQPEMTAEALRGGYMHTGDVGWLDGDGYVYIVDRIKDMIVSGGENVYCVEVENAIISHPAVKECAVIGIPHDQWGEAVHAEIVLKAGQTASAEAIIEHCRPLIAGFKLPRSIGFRDSMPLSAANKILKSELRRPYWEGRAKSVN